MGISSLVEKYLVAKRKIISVDKADILLTKLIIRGGDIIGHAFGLCKGKSQGKGENSHRVAAEYCH